MALAATLAATGARPVSFLPTITCSNCAAEIEIAAMGEHICAPAVAAPVARKSRTSSLSNPFRLRNYTVSGRESASQAREGNAASGMASSQNGSAKQPRIVLPKINSDAANRAFLAPKQAGPSSPLTPAISIHSGSSSGRPQFPRSTTSPMPRLYDPRPPSPELTANLDCAFPPFPTQALGSGRSTPSNGRGTPTGSERARSRAASRAYILEPEMLSAEVKSPRVVLQKFETLRSGPFMARRQDTGDSKEDFGVLDQERPNQAATEEHVLSTVSADFHSAEQTEAEKETSPPRPARLSYEQLSPILLDRFSAEPDSMLPPQPEPAHRADRNNTYPLPQEPSHKHNPSLSLSRMRSEPALRLPERKASLATVELLHTPIVPEIGTVLPKRSSSKIGTRIDYRMENAPPVPRPVQQHRNYSTHTPSESGSSTVSSSNTYSSGPSPVSSAASSVDPFSPLSFASASHEENEQLRPTGLSVRNQQTPGIRAELPSHRSPPRKFARPAPSIDHTQKVDKMPQAPLESPTDPLLRLGTPYEPWQPVTPDSAKPGSISTQPMSLANSPQVTPTPSTISTPTFGASLRSASPLSPPAVESQRRPPRPTPAKPNCRGCGLMIEGKSVKAADGRLTGRWHKSCFVCRTCEKPFATADFYVIGNQPYCEHHYHEENGSLCNGCHRGIEGQYLETTSTKRFGSSGEKYHPRCFTCATCHEVLSEDYFEINGNVLCERHALATLRQQQLRLGPGMNGMDRRGMHAERRTTRLINPMMA